MQVQKFNNCNLRGVMLPINILAVAKWEQAWEYGEVFWEEGLARMLTSRKVDERNFL